MSKWSEFTGRSILFGACVLAGLILSYVSGISGLEIAQTALLASVAFVVFLLGEAALDKHRGRPRKRR